MLWNYLISFIPWSRECHQKLTIDSHLVPTFDFIINLTLIDLVFWFSGSEIHTTKLAERTFYGLSWEKYKFKRKQHFPFCIWHISSLIILSKDMSNIIIYIFDLICCILIILYNLWFYHTNHVYTKMIWWIMQNQLFVLI